MRVGFIGLGKMGFKMVEKLLDEKHDVVVYNKTSKPARQLAKLGAEAVFSIDEFMKVLGNKKVIVLMVPEGKPVDDLLKGMKGYFQAGDIVIDGGNSYYEDSIRRYNELKKLNVSFLDMGTSGGLIGARTGASLMIGGDRPVFKKVEKLFLDLATQDGYAYLGSSGAGHFVKTVHNGVEYALLEAYGEGFGVLEKSKYDFDMKEVSKVWAHGSVIRSWIMDLAYEAFTKNPKLNKVPGVIGGGTTGKWALKISKKMKADSHTLEHALKRRKASKRKQNFASKFIAEMRNRFGGHKLDRG